MVIKSDESVFRETRSILHAELDVYVHIEYIRDMRIINNTV